MDTNRLIKRFSESLFEKRGVLFVGAGISKPSCHIGWTDLLINKAKDIGLSINERDDLPQIAQFIINKSISNRGPLIKEICRFFNNNFPLNPYHDAISLMNISTIWTTNYDTLLEKAFSIKHLDIEVKASNDSMSRSVLNHQIEIIKMHGCVKLSNSKDFVISKEDYEDYSIVKPAIVNRLRTDLMTKSFLFIGYSYRDPNLHNIMIEARRYTEKATQEHYLLLEKIDERRNPEEHKRQLFWCEDLKRFGIECVLINNETDLSPILYEISRKSRGNTVYCTGSHNKSSQLACDIGIKLAQKRDVILHSGQSAGISSNVVSAFTEECINQRIDIYKRLRTFPNPYSVNPDFSDNPNLLTELKNWRSRLLNATQVVIAFDGGMGTKAELEVARDLRCKIIPVPTEENDFIKEMLKDDYIINYLKEVDPEYLEKLKGFNVTAEDVVSCVDKFLK
ncbi:MAG: SIR2 family protein [Desulfitobacteriaceae bacterium]|nr:SIR2 family protein [Desulfitobacteriaceae bacterium]MDD4753907.1 SIR2 family protein [Desulfitobacteriaceae bacterium]